MSDADVSASIERAKGFVGRDGDNLKACPFLIDELTIALCSLNIILISILKASIYFLIVYIVCQDSTQKCEALYHKVL